VTIRAEQCGDNGAKSFRSSMSEGIQLTISQQFEQERLTRAIESTMDPVQLQTLAKQLLHAWQSQRAATDWIIRQHAKGI
tara:strand:- start:171 stop:410 length:240 start_codon:yes stop_codon:yes gene_type:complete